MRYTIPLSYNPIDIPKLTEVLSRYEGMHHNQMIVDFEDGLTKKIGAEHVVALNSGTAAIHLALKILGVGPGDIVIVPAFTYIATVNPVRYLGAEPVFIDSESDTWNIDPDLLEKAILDIKSVNKLPKAIIVVHTYGMPSQMDEILKLAENHGIPVVEDAAEAIGSTYNGKHIGTLGSLGIYSFNNNKVLTTYGGGAIATKNHDWAIKARFLASQARENLPYYEHKEVGHNYAMSPLSAAAGLSQLWGLDESIEKRRAVFEKYKEALDLQFQPERAINRSNRWFSAILFKDGATQLRAASVLEREGIETRPLWRPMHLQPLYRNYKMYDSGLSLDYFQRGLCLPSGGSMQPETQEKVIAELQKCLGYK